MLFRFALYVILAHAWCGAKAELRKLIPTCANSCYNPSSHSSTYCYCDSKCSLTYNDCCLDAPYRGVRETIKRKQNMDCVFVHGENRHFLMVGSCKESWIGHQGIIDKCEGPTVVSAESGDILGSIPVTNPLVETTFKNYFCGICNNQSVEDLVEWRVKVLCSSKDVSDDDVLMNLTYVVDKQQWGVYKESPDSELNFHECHLLFKRPSFNYGVRQCVPGMVSSCPPSWKNMAVRRKCKSYVDPVTWSHGLVYRNMDCAACHNQTGNNFHCLYDVARASSDAMLGLATTLDFNSVIQWL